MTFYASSQPRSRRARTCPECGEGIPTGARYTRFCFTDGGCFVHGLHCEACEALSDRLGASLQLFDPCGDGYRVGDLIAEANEHCGLDQDAAHEALPPPAQRDALIVAIAAMDRDEIAARRAESRQRQARNTGLLGGVGLRLGQQTRTEGARAS